MNTSLVLPSAIYFCICRVSVWLLGVATILYKTVRAVLKAAEFP